MHSTSFAVSLMVTLLLHSAISVKADISKKLKPPETPNKFASPQLYVFDRSVKKGFVISPPSHFNSSTGEWKETARMSEPRIAFFGAVVGTEIYLIGGFNTQKSEYTTTVEVYDCATETYRLFESMPRARAASAAAVLDDYIYVAGGVGEILPGTTMAPVLNTVFRVNIHTTRWENVSSMHYARVNPRLVELGGRLYAIGGSHTVEAYNATTDQWTFVASTIYQHVGDIGGAAVHEGKIYVVSHLGFEVYSPEADKWEILTPPNNYAGTALVSMNGKLWAMGGNPWGEPETKSVFTYDTSTKQWTQQADMNVGRSRFEALVVHDLNHPKPPETPNQYNSSQLYVFGGTDESKNLGSTQYFSSASQFNSSTGEWEATTAMSRERSFLCGAVVGTKVYLFGGTNNANSYFGLTETAEVYDCQTGVYSPFRSLPSPRASCGAAVLGDFIYVAGGNNGSRMSSVVRYNIHTTHRESVSSMHTPRDGLQLVELSGRLFAIGGVDLRTVEAYNPTTDRWTMMASTHYTHQHFGAAVHEGKLYVCSNSGFEVYTRESDEWRTLTPIDNFRGGKLVSMNGKLWAVGGESSKSVHTYNTSTNIWTEHADMDAVRMHHAAFVVNH